MSIYDLKKNVKAYFQGQFKIFTRVFQTRFIFAKFQIAFLTSETFSKLINGSDQNE